MPRWSIDLMSSRTRFVYQSASHLGTVNAVNAKEAVDLAIKQFKIAPANRNRITVTKLRERNDD